MPDWTERAFDQVNEITKQVLALAAAIVTVSITFVKDFASHASAVAKDLLAWSWFAYVGSIALGLLTLMASAGIQAAKGAALDVPEGDRTPRQQEAARGSVSGQNLRILGAGQLLCFFAGVVLTVVAGAMAV